MKKFPEEKKERKKESPSIDAKQARKQAEGRSEWGTEAGTHNNRAHGFQKPASVVPPIHGAYGATATMTDALLPPTKSIEPNH